MSGDTDVRGKLTDALLGASTFLLLALGLVGAAGAAGFAARVALGG